MAIRSSIPAWKIPWTEEPGRLQSLGHNESTERLHFLHFLASELELEIKLQLIGSNFYILS